MSDFKNADCIAGLKEYPDKYFDLAIVDPPYGDGQGGSGGTRYGGMFNKTIDGSPTRTKRQKAEQEKYYNRFGQRFDRYKRDKEKPVERRGGQWASKYENHIITWDVAPPQEYFDELFRVSKNQIIWGGELLFFTTDAVLHRMAQGADTRFRLFYGTCRVRVDKF